MPLRKSAVCVLRSIAIALVLLIACATIVLATPAEDAYQQGKNLVGKKDYKGAITLLDNAISLDPKLAAAYVTRGLANMEMRQPIKVIMDDCSKAISLGTRDPQAFMMRGCAYFDLGQRQKAIDDISQAISLTSNDVQRGMLYALRGCFYWKVGQYHNSIIDYGQAIIFIPILWQSTLILLGALTAIMLIAWYLIARRKKIKLGTKTT